jgi:hypothetical protein
MSKIVTVNGDLNNTSAIREVTRIEIDPTYSYRSLALSEEEDDHAIREKYRPFILDPHITSGDWISKLELSTVVKLAEEDLHKNGERLKVLVLYGSLRERYAPTCSFYYDIEIAFMILILALDLIPGCWLMKLRAFFSGSAAMSGFTIHLVCP